MKELVEKIQKEGCNTAEACKVVEEYIYLRKGKRVSIKWPITIHEIALLAKAYYVAAEYILYRYHYPENFKTT